ncbi:MAG: hypothetical protein JKY12_05230 [Sneathiella sp.]|nr:hypothetical protein [Sneathiella sp.]
MNFAGKKLNRYYTEAREISAREEKLLAENRSLKKKNKRLSTAMIYLVDQIEVRLPLWVPKPPVAEKKKTPAPEPKIIGEARKPRSQPPLADPRPNKIQSQPLSLQRIFTDKKKTKASKTPFVSPPTQKAEPVQVSPVIVEIAEPAEVIKNDLSLEPEEIILLAAPTKENAKEPEILNSSENIVERVAKKTSLKEASLTYMAVSVAASPVPNTKELEDDDPTESKESMHNKIMKEAMLRRVNRLRW